MLVIVKQGLLRLLEMAVNRGEMPADLTLRLFANDRDPEEEDTAKNYTEVQGFGYSPIKLTGEKWAITDSGIWSAAYPEQIFVFNGSAGNVFGYMLTRAEELFAAERFGDGPYLVKAKYSEIKVQPNLEISKMQEQPKPERTDP